MRFLGSMLSFYEKRRVIILSAIIVTMLFFYFVPFDIIYISGLFYTFLYEHNALVSLGLSGVYANWVSYNAYIQPIFILILLVFSIACIGASYKFPKLVSGSMPYFVFVLYRVVTALGTIDDFMSKSDTARQAVYSIFLMLVTLACTSFIAILSIAYSVSNHTVTIYRKSPREHKPTKSERIAELERQVAELTKEKDAE